MAELLSEWLSCVIQAVRPWISTRDLDRGSLWFGEINDQLQETGDFQERCHSLAAFQATWINGSA